MLKCRSIVISSYRFKIEELSDSAMISQEAIHKGHNPGVLSCKKTGEPYRHLKKMVISIRITQKDEVLSPLGLRLETDLAYDFYHAGHRETASFGQNGKRNMFKKLFASKQVTKTKEFKHL